MVAGHLVSSYETHCFAQESREEARGTGATVGGIGRYGLLAFCHILCALGHFERVLMQQRNCLTFKMPSLITLSISDSAD
jgi:hypothetical protein